MPSFFDSNTLLYFAEGEGVKADRISLLFRGGGWISVQVLNEATRVMIHKWHVEWDSAREALAYFHSIFSVVPVDIETHQLGLDIAEHYKIGVFDSMIVAAALQAGCDTLYSEDMHHGLLIEDRLRVVNPFRE